MPKTRERVQSVIALLGIHYDRLKGFPEYQKIVATMTALDMILTNAGFGLVMRIETEKLGHSPTPGEMLGVLIRIICDLNDIE